MVEVFDSFETVVEVAESILKTETNSITGNGQITIDNTNNLAQYPVFEITGSSASLTGNWLTNGTQVFNTSSISLNTGDTLLLDFKDQRYLLNGSSIIDDISFPNNELIELEENENNIFDINVSSGSISISVDYYAYLNGTELHYVEGFDVEKGLSYKKNKPFNSNHRKSVKLQDESISFSLERMAVDYYFYQKIYENSDFRIKYEEFNPDTLETNIKYLVGVNFENWERGSKMGHFILVNVHGKATKIMS